MVERGGAGKSKVHSLLGGKTTLELVFSLITYITPLCVDLPAAVTRTEPGKRCNVIVAVIHSKSITGVQMKKITGLSCSASATLDSSYYMTFFLQNATDNTKRARQICFGTV